MTMIGTDIPAGLLARIKEINEEANMAQKHGAELVNTIYKNHREAYNETRPVIKKIKECLKKLKEFTNNLVINETEKNIKQLFVSSQEETDIENKNEKKTKYQIEKPIENETETKSKESEKLRKETETKSKESEERKKDTETKNKETKKRKKDSQIEDDKEVESVHTAKKMKIEKKNCPKTSISGNDSDMTPLERKPWDFSKLEPNEWDFVEGEYICVYCGEDQGDEISMEKHFNDAKCYITLDQNGNAKNKEDSKENENPITKIESNSKDPIDEGTDSQGDSQSSIDGFSCKNCQVGPFQTVEELNEHTKASHRIPCKFCLKEGKESDFYATRGYLKVHQKQMHAELLKKLEERRKQKAAASKNTA